MVQQLILIGLLGLAGLAAAVLVGLGVAAYARRSSVPYLLVLLALTTLLARVGIAMGTVTELFSAATHHLAEHALDVLMVALVVGAVLAARFDSGAKGNSTQKGRDETMKRNS
ncbi:MAG: hypothetical protein ABEI98_04945 [Halorhabdus sp.]